ncbi:MAG: MarR family transcriptional regulator [Pseudomonadota bacterium]
MQEKRLDEKLKSIELTRVTWCVLLAIVNEGLLRPSEIATFVGIDRTATSRALKQMEAAGLIERTAGTGDRRTRTASATAAGMALVGKGTPMAEDNARLLSEKLTAQEEQDLRALLAKLRKGEEIALDHF